MIVDLGRIAYKDAYKIQKEYLSRRISQEINDCLLLAEHEPVYTIGRSAPRIAASSIAASLTQRGYDVIYTDRGGDITYHGPGQLVAYMILDLKRRGRDLHKHLRDLEEAVIMFLKKYHVAGRRIVGRSGVWVNDMKISSVGIGSSHWVTYHGISININANLDNFSIIEPCGLKGIAMTSLESLISAAVSFEDAKADLVNSFSELFFERTKYTDHGLQAS